MKGTRGYMDLGSIFDEIFDAAKNFTDDMHHNFGQFASEAQGAPNFCGRGPFASAQDENIDYYPTYSYPPMNVYMTANRSLVFEFALAGFDEKGIDLSFQGDHMVFSAHLESEGPEEEVRFLKRRLKLKDIDRQKYLVPADKFDQAKVKAVFKNGILRITVPPKPEPDAPEGIKIEIIKEGE